MSTSKKHAAIALVIGVSVGTLAIGTRFEGGNPIIRSLLMDKTVPEVAVKNVPSIESSRMESDYIHSVTAQWGKQVFNEHCAACHGASALGSDNGPTLIHDYYKPSHHSDQSFYSAVQRGVQPHHWEFGPMPALSDRVSIMETRAVIEYVRELQSINGIFVESYQY